MARDKYRLGGPFKRVAMTPEQQERQDRQAAWLEEAIAAQHRSCRHQTFDRETLKMPCPRT